MGNERNSLKFGHFGEIFRQKLNRCGNEHPFG